MIWNAKRRSISLAVGMALAPLLATTQASAAPAAATRSKSEADGADDNARVRSLFRKAALAFEARKHDQARKLLLEAWAIRQSYDVASSLAQTEIELERYRDAAEHLAFCIRNFAPVESEQTLQQVRKAFADVKTRVATVNVTSDRNGAEIFVDNLRVGVAPLPDPLFLEPGNRQLAARLEGKVDGQRLNAEAGKEYTLQFSLRAAEPPLAPAIAAVQVGSEAPSSKQEAPKDSPDYTPAIVAGSVGAAALVSGIVFILQSSRQLNERDDQLAQLPGSNQCGPQSPYGAQCAEIASLSSSAKTLQSLSIAAFGIAAAAGVTTVVLWPRTPEHGQVGMRALVLPSSAGLDVFTGLNASF
ncbi:MAG TPA: hypothetical protein VJV79_27605 [Polyangiaceae bacterium]|nr:hypothetical protein [Polyangiaceae bacterium]